MILDGEERIENIPPSNSGIPGHIGIVNNEKQRFFSLFPNKPRETLKIQHLDHQSHKETWKDILWYTIPEKRTLWGSENEGIQKSYAEIKINSDEDIKEYFSWIPDHLIGEQLFSKKALDRLWLWEELPANAWVIEEISGVKPEERNNPRYIEFYEKYIQNRLTGCSDPERWLIGIDKSMIIRLADGSCAVFYSDHWRVIKVVGNLFFSVYKLAA